MTRCLLTALVAAMAIGASPAAAAEGDPFLDSCLTGIALSGCATDRFVDRPLASAVSGDGRSVYVGVLGDGSTRGAGILQFDRTAGGALVRHPGVDGCVTTNGNPSEAGDPTTRRCGVGSSLGSVNGLHVVGNSLYATTLSGSSLLTFDIDPATGELTQKAGPAGCVRHVAPNDDCGGAEGLSLPGPMAHKADGSALYVRTSYGLAVFSRAPDGTLAQKAGTAGCWQEDGGACSDGAGLASGVSAIRQIAVVGDTLYVPFNDGRQADDLNGGAGVFSINADGTLAQAQDTSRCVSNDGQSGIGDDVECTSTGREEHTVATVVTGSGADVYLGHGKGVDHFRRGTGGALQPAGCNGGGAGCTAANAIASASWLGLSPDGSELVVADVPTAALGFLRRDAATGTLTQRADPADCVSRNGAAGACQTVAALGSPATLVFAPDSLTLYSTGHDHDSIVALDRDFAPTCLARTAGTPFDTPVVVPLACTDVNGDALTLEITDAPVHGSPAGIDQASGTVRYSPALGFTGTDRFRFRAVSRGGAVNSAPAEVTVSVAGPPAAGARPVASAAPPGRIAFGVDFFFDASNPRFTKVGRLAVTSIPAGATLEVRCVGGRRKGCGFKSRKRTFATVAETFSVKPYFTHIRKVRGKRRRIASRLKRGTKIEVRVTAPGMTGKVVTFRTRSGRRPTVAVGCLPLGATTVRRTC